MRPLFTMLMLALLLALVLGPAAAQDAPLVLTYGGNQDIDNIDPATGENYSINAALLSLYDALFIVRGTEVEPNLVDTYEVSDDASVFTFTLKADARFHDGSPVNAAAVVYSFNRALELAGPPTYRWQGIADASSAQAIDDLTVQFTLTQPFAPFIGTLTQLFIVNPAVVEANRGDDFGQTYLRTNAAGSGPFVQGRWEIGSLYEFVAVPDYWGGWPTESHVDSVLWLIQRDSSTQVNSLLARETLVSDTPSGPDLGKIDEDPGLRIENNPSILINTLKMNNQGEYTSDLNVRRAIAYAMNYAALPEVQDIPVEVLPGPTPLNFAGAVADLEVPSYDLEMARSYLAQSPWPDGGFSLDYVYVADFTREEIPGLLLLEGLAQLNITLNMVPMLWPDMVASCASPESGPDIINIYTQPAYLDMDAHLYNQYHSAQWGSYNSCSFYSNPEVDALLDQARVLGDPAARAEAYNQAQRLIAADQPSVWMYTENTVIGLNECVTGYVYRPLEALSLLFRDIGMENCPA